MKQKLEIVAEIQKLFCEEAASIDHTLSPRETLEREERQQRLSVLFERLQSPPRGECVLAE
jgi:hypothetical protein